ncbi:MAG TPA: arsenate reductase ArsC [Burkholderiales bacterium]|nr:arsenate reductase ArsC [Burkholderiales bacterium]
MAQPVYNVLFLCTGNSARSVMAEVLLNTLGKGRFKAHSAGSQPAGKVNPFTLELLRSNGHSVEGLRSKSWDEFARPDAPKMDFVITVCDNAAGEICPVWPGQPMTAHWGFQDPAALEGSDEEKHRLFRSVYQQITHRLRVFLSLPMASLDRLSLQQMVRDIGKVAS